MSKQTFSVPPNATPSDLFNLLRVAVLADLTALNIAENSLAGLKSADIASATTTDLSTATGQYVKITGTVTITGLGTMPAGTIRFLRFTGILTLTHNGTSLILPTAANITTAANDRAIMVSDGAGNWFCLAYLKASGAALA